MKLLLAAVAAAVLLLTAGTIWVGSHMREGTVVAHPYEEGLEYDQQRRSLAESASASASKSVSASASESASASASESCDLGVGPCARPLGELELTLDFGPRPLRAMRELAVTGRLTRGGAPASGAEMVLSFAMPGMSMGENVSRLSAAEAGLYRGKAVLVRCHSGRRDWIATAIVRYGGEERRADFALRLAE